MHTFIDMNSHIGLMVEKRIWLLGNEKKRGWGDGTTLIEWEVRQSYTHTAIRGEQRSPQKSTLCVTVGIGLPPLLVCVSVSLHTQTIMVHQCSWQPFRIIAHISNPLLHYMPHSSNLFLSLFPSLSLSIYLRSLNIRMHIHSLSSLLRLPLHTYKSDILFYSR